MHAGIYSYANARKCYIRYLLVYAVTNYCEGSPCSHLCLLSSSSPTNYTCACPEGTSLMDDGVNCTEVSNVTATPPRRGIGTYLRHLFTVLLPLSTPTELK